MEAIIKAIVADAGLLLPQAGTVGLDKFEVDLWTAHTDEEYELAVSRNEGEVMRATNHGQDIDAALDHLQDARPGLLRSQVFFLSRRADFIEPFISDPRSTCGAWTRIVGPNGGRGMWKASIATGWCPARCNFCYLLPKSAALFGHCFYFQGLALNVGDFAAQVVQERQIRNKTRKVPHVNMGETGGLLEWAEYFDTPEIVQAYLDATLAGGVTPYILTKRALSGLDLAGVHVGISVNVASVMAARSPGASTPTELLDFVADAKAQGASTVVRWGPIMAGREDEYADLAQEVHRRGLGAGRITVDLLRFTDGHEAMPADFEYRVNLWQERAEVQLAHLRRVRDFFPQATITGCKLDASVALGWVRQGVINSMPCACWT
jgi:DNA repair photolyase